MVKDPGVQFPSIPVREVGSGLRVAISDRKRTTAVVGCQVFHPMMYLRGWDAEEADWVRGVGFGQGVREEVAEGVRQNVRRAWAAGNIELVVEEGVQPCV